jgi:hypothetical protein
MMSFTEARPEVLDQHVGALDQLLGDRPPLLLAHVDADRALAGVEAGEPDRQSLVGGLPLAREVARRRVLDLDHVGAEVAEHPAGRGSGVHGAELDDLDPGEWSVLAGHVVNLLRSRGRL